MWSWIRNKLVKQAIEKFGIEGDFDVRKQTIFNCISSNRLQVWHPGTESPLLEVEVILTSFIYKSSGTTKVKMRVMINNSNLHSFPKWRIVV